MAQPPLTPGPRPGPAHPAIGYKPPRHLSRLKAWGLSLAVAAALVAGYVVLWFAAAQVTRQAIEGWDAARRAEGWRVEHGPVALAGFPLHVRAILDKPLVALPEGRGAWAGVSLTLEGRPWNWTRFTLRAPGRQSITLPDGRVLDGAATRLEAEVRLSGGRATAVDLNLEGLRLAGPDLDLALAKGHLAASRLATDKPAGPQAEILLETEGATLPNGGLDLPLGRQVEKATLRASLTGPLPAALHHTPLAAWRDAGGTIEIQSLALVYGPLSLMANGTMALDGNMQPLGALTAKAEGFFETVEALEKRGLVKPRDATTAKIVLGALARKPRNGGPAAVNFPLSIQERRIFAGPVPLVKLEPIVWPGTPEPTQGAPGPAPVREEKP